MEKVATVGVKERGLSAADTKKGTKATAGVCFCPFAMTVLVGCRLRVWATALPCPIVPSQLCEKELQIVDEFAYSVMVGAQMVEYLAAGRHTLYLLRLCHAHAELEVGAT